MKLAWVPSYCLDLLISVKFSLSSYACSTFIKRHRKTIGATSQWEVDPIKGQPPWKAVGHSTRMTKFRLRLNFLLHQHLTGYVKS